MNPLNPLSSQNPSNPDQASVADPRPAENPSAEPSSSDGGGGQGRARPTLRDRLPPLRGAGGVALGFALLFVLIGGQWLELGQRVSQTREQMAQRLAESAAQLREAKSVVAAAQESLQAQASKIVVLEAKVSSLQDSHAALEGLYQELARGRDEWLLAEVDQLVGLAVQQLQLAGNVQGAKQALGNADARLARSERPQFIALRKAIARDLQKLNSVPSIDLAGMALRIESAALAVDQMPLAFEARPLVLPAAAKEKKTVREVRSTTMPPGNELTQWWQRWSAEFWGEFRNLIRVERFDRPEPAVLAPQHSLFLRENLKLRLLGARLALLGRDQATFKGELKQAVNWLERYFDLRDRTVAIALESIRPLMASDLSIEAPTLTESQSALRSIRLAGERAPR